MPDREIGDNGNFADLFFASILDPEANVRRLTAIQAEGFRAASELVDRFLSYGGPLFLGNGAGGSAERSRRLSRRGAKTRATIPTAR